jgi:hypothetical protein
MRHIKLAAVAATAALAAGCTSAYADTPAPAQQHKGWPAVCATGSNGQCSITNQAATVPDAVTVTPRVNVLPVVVSTSAATITVRFLKAGSTAAFVGAVSFDVHVDYTPVPPTTAPTTAPTTQPTTPAPPTSPTPTPTDTPPTGTPGGGFPDATTTGVPAGVTLTAYTGPTTVPANTTISGKDITGCLVIGGDGVTIVNSRVHGDCAYVVDSYGHTGTPLKITDSEVYCTGDGGTGVGEENVTLLRVNIHSCENGLDVNTKFSVTDSYIHDLYQSDVAHSDGAQIWAKATGLLFEHNTIYAGGNYNGTIVNGTSSIIMPQSADGGVINSTVDDNQFSGGAYSLYCVQNGPGTNLKITNNHFTSLWEPKGGEFGPWTDCEDEIHSGNTLDGKALD